MKIKRLSAIGKVIKGVSFDRGEATDLPASDFVPILRAGNITSSGLDLETDTIWVPKSRVSPSQMLRTNDVVICMSSGSTKILGKNAQLLQPWEGSIGAFCAIIRFGEEINPRYGSYWLKNPVFVQWRDSQAKGANIQNLRKSSLEELEIPIPPLAEQERIVCLLDEADALRKLRTQASARMDEFVPALFHEMFGDPIINPKKWNTRRVSELCNLVRGSSPRPKSDPKFYGGPIPRLMIEDITRDGWLVTPKVDSLTEEGAKLSRPVPAGTVVMAVSANIGLMAKLAVDACIHDGFVGFKNLDENTVNTDYFVFCLTYLREESKRFMAGAIFQNLTVAQVNALSLPIPPLNIQLEFAQRVQEVREIQSRQAQSAERIEELYQSMLSRAFAGEL